MVRTFKRALSWLELHPRVSYLFAFVIGMAAVMGLVLTFYFHAEENSKLKAERVARQAAAVAQAQSSRTTAIAIRKVLCPLVHTYQHLNAATVNTVQVAEAWRALGTFIGCPEGGKG